MPDLAPDLALDPGLPISAHADEIAALIRARQVVVVAGETGSGKTTQLPKICLALGRGSIGHTQPRRIAARSVAARIAEELGEPLGGTVGFQVRFTAAVGEATRLKVMTDGILLAEIGRDRDLRRYDTIIVDEAHERSLNIDFLLGYLKQLLPRRPDLKVVITSATIDTARFSAHFWDAPVVEVSGRAYPVEVRYRPVGPDQDQADAIVAALGELGGMGDVLVFLAGEREIKDAAKAVTAARLPHTEVLPLFARLSLEEQSRVFAPHAGRRIVLATNVAETSLTVPGVRAVIDPGRARIARYSPRTKVLRLPVEDISRASADQRAGRCGRVGPGVCVRLYSEEDFAGRPAFTEPEILRANLASVVLQMAHARLGDIADFPFVEPPDRTLVVDGLRLLEELDAVTGSGAELELTPVGRQLAALPVDPRLGRVLVEANRRHCLKEAITVVAALSLPDVRERPADHREEADALHARFLDPSRGAAGGGDFGALLNLWRHLKEQRRVLGSNQFRRLCRREFVNHVRVREWWDLVNQLRDVAKSLGWRLNHRAADLDDVLKACLAGLLSHIGVLSELPAKGKPRGPREYLGARGVRFALSPGSGLAKTPPDFVVAAELVETTRLWAATAAAIDPAWAEEVGAHLVKRSYSEPWFVAESGTVVAGEQVTLLGVTLAAGRRVAFARIDPAAARATFLQAALVEDRLTPRPGSPYASVHAKNALVRQRVRDLEERARRRDLLADDRALYAWFNARLPEDVLSAATLDHWLRADPANLRLLELREQDLIRPEAEEADADAYPDMWSFGPDAPERALPLTYSFAPGEDRDGVVVSVALAQLAGLAEAPFTWGVRGRRVELATALIKSLPKAQRTRFVPAPDWAAKAVAWLDRHGDTTVPFTEELSRALSALGGADVSDWDVTALPDHLRVGFLVADGKKQTFGRDLPELQKSLVQQVTGRLAKVSDRPRNQGTTWVFGTLPERLAVKDRGVVAAAGPARRDDRERLAVNDRRVVATAYPALRDDKETVSEVLLPTLDAARAAHTPGVTRLLWFDLPDPTRWVTGHLANPEKLALGTSPYPSAADLMADARWSALLQLTAGLDPWQVRDEAAFRALADAVRPENPARMRRIVATAAQTLTRKGTLEQLLPRFAGSEAGRDVRAQLDDLVFKGFLHVIPEPWLWRLPTYLEAAERRLRQALTNPARDGRAMDELDPVLDAYHRAWQAHPGGTPELKRAGYLIEELRVQLFAQPMPTAEPVSVKKVTKVILAAT